MSGQGMERNLQKIWDALWACRENEINDRQWDEITFAMSKIHEALDIPPESID